MPRARPHLRLAVDLSRAGRSARSGTGRTCRGGGEGPLTAGTAPRLVVTELHVADVARSLRFYRDLLGVPFGDIERHVDDAVAHAHASWGSWREGDAFLRLNLYPVGEGTATHSVIGFVVDDLDVVHERVSRAAVEVRQAPTQKSWGRTAMYADPDGNEVLLTEVAR